MVNVYNVLSDSAAKWPDQLAVSDEFGELSFMELTQETEKLRSHLLHLGVKPGTGVAIITGNSRYFIISLFAVIGCNAVAMPVSPQLKNAEIRTAIQEGQLHFVIADTHEAEYFDGGSEPIHLFGQTLFFGTTGRSGDLLTAPMVPDAAFIRFTSGTTGKSKGVVISHRSVLERVDAANEALRLGETDRVVWVLPMAYHFVVSIVLYLRYGAGIIINDVFLAENIIQTIQKMKGTFLYAAPMHIKLLAAYREEVFLPTLTKVISTTTGISAQVCEAFKEKYNIPVSQAYGIIEIGLPIINLHKSAEFPEAVGYALPAYSVGILDAAFNLLPDETVGQLGIKGPGMFDAYLSPPALRKDILKNGWFLTGDLAIRNKDGLIIIRGREKNMINVSGNKVFPNEVEDVVNNYPGVVQSCAYAKSHALLGEVVAIDIVADKNTAIDNEALLNYCKKYLANFKVPQFVYQVEAITLTGSGKVKRV
jgi:long-chain acyl-CoA synthetase